MDSQKHKSENNIVSIFFQIENTNSTLRPWCAMSENKYKILGARERKKKVENDTNLHISWNARPFKNHFQPDETPFNYCWVLSVY